MKRLVVALAITAMAFACTKVGPEPGSGDPTDPQKDTTIVQPADTTVVDPVDTTVVGPTDPVDTIPSPEISGVADILDVEFLPDGTARNLVEGGIACKTVSGASLCTYYNADYGRYAAHFNLGTAGGSLPSGYFKADYTSNSAVKDKIADGHTLEVVLRLDCVSSGSLEIKAMCSQQSGGTGIMVSASGQGTCLTFLPNVSTSGSSNWCWTKSGIKPAAGQYYHVVGVWDKAAGTSKIYVDGELKATTNTSGNFNFAQSGATWFCIGGDAAGANAAESGWWGDIVIARVYDTPIDADKVAELWQAADRSAPANFVLSGIDYQTAGNVAPGCRFNVYASGFASGDVLRFCSDSGTTFDCETSFETDHISAEIPSSIADGSYTLLAVRDGQIYPLGRTSVTVADPSGSEGGSVQCIAHRGYHPNSSYPENSIAALKYAQDLGCYGSEFDVWTTTDGELYINHDGTLSGVTISTSTSAQVAGLKLSNGENIPTLRQYLEQGSKVPAVKMILELKHYAATDGSVAIVKEMQMEDQVEWISFDYSACKKVHQLLPAATVMYLGGDKTPASVATDGLSGIDYSYSVLTSHRDWIAQAHEKGLVVNVWTVDSDFQTWIASGVDFITTNQSEQLLNTLRHSYVEF